MVEPGPNIKLFWNAAGIPQSGSHAALAVFGGASKRCRRRALPPQSKKIIPLYGVTISKGMAGRAPSGNRWLLFAFGLAALVSAGRGM